MPAPADRRYRAILIPTTVDRADAELKATQGVLPFVQLKAANSEHAAFLANHVTGLPVISVQRVEAPT